MTARLVAYAALAAVLALGAGFGVGHYRGTLAERGRWETQQAREQRAMLERLAQRTRQVAALTAQQEQARQAAEENHARMDDQIAALRERLRHAGRLRDPGARPACGDTLPATAAGAGVSAPATAAAELSDRATEFLRAFAARCDTAAAYASACRGWVMHLPAP